MIERPRTRVRGRVLERHALQRTRAITRNTHPMLEHATITNFRDAFVLRDAHQGRTDPLFSTIILRTRLRIYILSRLNRNGNPWTALDSLIFSHPSSCFLSCQGNVISIFNLGNSLKNCNCTLSDALKSWKSNFHEHVELKTRRLALFLVTVFFRI